MVDRDSTYWPESLFERAWTNFWRQDLNATLGLLLTVNSPYFAEHEYIPEVRSCAPSPSSTFCEYDDRRAHAASSSRRSSTSPCRRARRPSSGQYKTPEGRKLADQAFDAYFAEDHTDSTLDKRCSAGSCGTATCPPLSTTWT